MTKPLLASNQSGYGGRGYRIPGRLDRARKQRVYPSVTTVLKQVNKPGLHQWIADQVAAFAVVNINYLLTRQDEVAWRYLRFYWSREPEPGDLLRLYADGVRDDAAELGTNVHEFIDVDLMRPDDQYPESMGPEVDEMLDQWDVWLEGHRVVAHHGEFTVVHDDLRYAGTADGDWTITCLHDGPGCFAGGARGPFRTLIDVKTSRYTWVEHGYQLAALWTAPIAMVEHRESVEGGRKVVHTVDKVKITRWWTERPNTNFERAALLHIRPRDLTPGGEPIPAFCELEDRTEDLDLYMQGFEGALALCYTARALDQRGVKRALAAA